MGEVSETTMTMTIKKKKKKGRPSLLDLQKRSIKEQQQQQQQNPNSFDSSSEDPSHRRSTSRNPNLDSPERISGDDDDERKEKKHKLLLGLNPHPQPQPHYPTLSPNSLLFNSGPYGSDSNAIIEDPEVALKRRKISVFHHGSDAMGEKFLKVTDTIHGSQVESESGPTTPLPDKKLLVFILDRLQKKDTYGVFSEPVDPEDLPDYHDIVEHPMDFGTVRKKLDEGAYANLEQFENDVLLICTNAMQYNASDTIFFRQARSMQELAKKDFENLRQESDDSEPQPKVVRRGRPPGKSLKKSLSRSPLEHVCPEPSLDATLASGGDNASGSNAYNLRKGPNSYKFQPADASVRASHGSHNSETCTSWWSEWENEFPASVLKSVLKYGKKQFAIDENRRDTYKHPLDSGHGPSVLATLEGELKQLMAVGLHLEHGYARSLTRFAADLGPVVWKIASKKIESVLPVGLKFGPGWIGENEVSKRHQSLFSEEKSTENLVRADHTSKLLPSSTFGPNSVVNGSLLQSGEDFEIARRLNSQSELTSLNNSVGEIKPVPPFQIQHKPTIHSDINGLNGGFVSDFSSQRKMVRLATLTGMSSSDDASLSSEMLGMNSSSNTTIYQIPRNDIESNEAKFSENPSRLQSGNLLSLGSGRKLYGTPEVGLGRKTSLQGLSMQRNHDSFSFPPDLNGTFWAPGSPSSNVQIGSPQHPDLALQL